jgi:ABC-type spermidine/putrescine transport system permease subunit II
MSLIGAVFLVPFIWLVVVAFQAHGSLQISGGGGFTLSHFATVLHGGSFVSAFGNSLYLGDALDCTIVGDKPANALSTGRRTMYRVPRR